MSEVTYTRVFMWIDKLSEKFIIFLEHSSKGDAVPPKTP